VKRLIYTASVVSASPLKEDGSNFKDVIDETCWTPLNDSLEYVYLDDPLYKVSCQLFILQFFQRRNETSYVIETICVIQTKTYDRNKTCDRNKDRNLYGTNESKKVEEFLSIRFNQCKRG